MMFKMRPIRLSRRNEILADLKRGYAQKEVAKRHRVSVATVGRLVQEAQRGHSTTPSRPGPRPALSSVQEGIFIAMVTEMGPWMAADQLLQFWHRVTRQQMSKATMRLHASRLGIRKPRASVLKHRTTSEESDALFVWWFELLCAAYADWFATHIRTSWSTSPRARAMFGVE